MQMSPIEFKYEVMICFWFSINIELLEAARILYKLDPIIGEIMKNFRSPEAKKLIEQHNESNQRKKRKDVTALSVSNDLSASMADRSKEIVQEDDIQHDNDDDDVENEEVFGALGK